MKRFGAYEILHALSEGGMGSVLLARRRGPGTFEQLVAITGRIAGSCQRPVSRRGRALQRARRASARRSAILDRRRQPFDAFDEAGKPVDVLTDPQEERTQSFLSKVL